MNELMSSNTLDSREVAEMVGKKHSDLLKDILKYSQYLTEGKIPLSDFFIKTQYQDNTGRALPCYRITKKGCEFIAHKLTGKKGSIFTATYINRFHQMEQVPAVPTTMKEVLMIALQREEELERKEQLLKEQQPKVLFADSVSGSSNSILVGQLATLINQSGVSMGQNKLFSWLRHHGFVHKSGEDRNLPTRKSTKLGLMEIKRSKVENKDGSIRTTSTTKITGKGQIYFLNKIVGERREQA